MRGGLGAVGLGAGLWRFFGAVGLGRRCEWGDYAGGALGGRYPYSGRPRYPVLSDSSLPMFRPCQLLFGLISIAQQTLDFVPHRVMPFLRYTPI